MNMGSTEEFDPDLLHRIRAVVQEGDVVHTLERRMPNVIERIAPEGILVTTQRSEANVGGPSLVPAWMFNFVWDLLHERERVERDHVDRATRGAKVKRSSAVFAILERLPEVHIVQRRPVALGRRRQT